MAPDDESDAFATLALLYARPVLELRCRSCPGATPLPIDSRATAARVINTINLREAQAEYAIMTEVMALFESLPNSRHELIVGRLSPKARKLRSGSAEEDEQFEAALRDRPEFRKFIMTGEAYYDVRRPLLQDAQTETVMPHLTCRRCGLDKDLIMPLDAATSQAYQDNLMEAMGGEDVVYVREIELDAAYELEEVITQRFGDQFMRMTGHESMVGQESRDFSIYFCAVDRAAARAIIAAVLTERGLAFEFGEDDEEED